MSADKNTVIDNKFHYASNNVNAIFVDSCV